MVNHIRIQSEAGLFLVSRVDLGLNHNELAVQFLENHLPFQELTDRFSWVQVRMVDQILALL